MYNKPDHTHSTPYQHIVSKQKTLQEVVNLKINKNWLKAAGIRALKTFAQTAIALLPAVATITDVDWVTVLSTAALSAVVSCLTSLAGLPECKEC